MMDQLAELRAQVAALADRVSTLESSLNFRSPAQPPPQDEGVKILREDPGAMPASFIQPSAAELRRLFDISERELARLVSGAFDRRRGNADEHFEDFRAGFALLAKFYRTPEIDHRRGSANYCEIYDSWAGRKELRGTPRIWSILTAAIAHGDIDGLVASDRIASNAFALSEFQTGTAATDAWRRVLKNGASGRIKLGGWNARGHLEPLSGRAA